MNPELSTLTPDCNQEQKCNTFFGKHATTVDKLPKNQQEDYFDDDNYNHNTTGDKDRKKRKVMKTLVLSGSKMYQAKPECPQIQQFCPETHSQENLNDSQQPRYSELNSISKSNDCQMRVIQQPHIQFNNSQYGAINDQYPCLQMNNKHKGLTERKKRNRKNPGQMQYLQQEYLKDPNWTKETCIRVSKMTGLTESQVYKWGWD